MQLSGLDIHSPFERWMTWTIENENRLDATGEEVANSEKDDAKCWVFTLSSTWASHRMDYSLSLANPDAKRTQSIYIGEKGEKTIPNIDTNTNHSVTV